MTGEEFGPAYVARLEGAHDHWWVRGMRRVAAALLGDIAGAEVLDAGCGSGANLAWARDLTGDGPAAAIDVSYAAVAACRVLRIDTVLAQASVTDLPFPSERFDVVLCMDVLQHLTPAAEQRSLREFGRVLRPGGRLLARTGAAFGRGHVPEREQWRLYTPSRLAGAAEAAGLNVERVTHANSLPGLWASIPRPRRAPSGDEDRPEWSEHGFGIPVPGPRWKDTLLDGLLGLEARWLSRPDRRLSFGHSLWVLARKPAQGSTRAPDAADR